MVARVYRNDVDISAWMIRGGYAQIYSATLRKAARVLKNGGKPTSATPRKRLITPPARTNGLPVSMPSMRRGTDRTIVKHPAQP
jgi:endonuclease YncB( thermonuclease family)